MTLMGETRDMYLAGSTGKQGSGKWPLNPPSTSTALYRDSLDETNAHADAFDWYYAELYTNHFRELPLVPWNILYVWVMADVIASYLHFQASSVSINGVPMVVTRSTLQRWTRHMIVLADYNLLGPNSATYGTISPRVFHGMLPDRSDSLPARLFTSYIPNIEEKLNLPFGPEQVIAPVQVYHPPTLRNPLQHLPVKPNAPTVKRHRESPEVDKSPKHRDMVTHPVVPDGWAWVDPEGMNSDSNFSMVQGPPPIPYHVNSLPPSPQAFNDPTNPFVSGFPHHEFGTSKFDHNIPAPAAIPSGTANSVAHEQAWPYNVSTFVDTLTAAYVQEVGCDASTTLVSSNTLVSSPNRGSESGANFQPRAMRAETLHTSVGFS